MVEVLINFAKAATSRLDKLLSRRSTLRPPCKIMSPVDALDMAILPLSALGICCRGRSEYSIRVFHTYREAFLRNLSRVLACSAALTPKQPCTLKQRIEGGRTKEEKAGGMTERGYLVASDSVFENPVPNHSLWGLDAPLFGRSFFVYAPSVNRCGHTHPTTL